MWDGGAEYCIGSESVRVWDPATDTYTPVPIPDPDELTDIFCSAQTVLADGRVLIVGGHECNDPNYSGQANAYLFDPATHAMDHDVERHGVSPLVSDRDNAGGWPCAGNVWFGRNFYQPGSAAGDFRPSNEHFHHAHRRQSSRCRTTRTCLCFRMGMCWLPGRLRALPRLRMLNVATQTWSTVDPRLLDGGSAVMYLPGKIMKTGSAYIPGNFNDYVGLPGKATTYVIDMTQPSPAWQQTASMANARTDLNLTVLPDGNVIAIGGSRDISGIEPSYAVSTGRDVVSDHADVDDDGQHADPADVSLDRGAAAGRSGVVGGWQKL